MPCQAAQYCLPWAAFQGWLDKIPLKCRSVLQLHVPALPPAPCRYVAQATHTGFLAPRGRAGRMVMAWAHPNPYIPTPSVFQLYLQPRQERHAPLPKPAGLVCKNPKRTNAALSPSSDSWPSHFTHHMRGLNLIKKAWRIFPAQVFFQNLLFPSSFFFSAKKKLTGNEPATAPAGSRDATSCFL